MGSRESFMRVAVRSAAVLGLVRSEARTSWVREVLLRRQASMRISEGVAPWWGEA